MKVYKGTDKDIRCKGYQFTPGVEAVEEEAKLCSKGFHACEAPLDVLQYYAPGDGSRYFEAELEEVSEERHNSDTKVCGKRITLGAEIGIPGLIKAQFEYVKSQCSSGNTGGYWSALTGGDRSALTGGDWSALTGGDWSALTGGYSSALTGGYWSALRGGAGSRFRGGLWSVFVCEIRDRGYNLVGVKAAVVGGENIKPNVWYILKDGEFVEADNAEGAH